jgi:ribosomal protein S18 acetylase RimI-like enzyme
MTDASPTSSAAESSVLRLAHADSDAEIAACFAVMRELRPHLASADELVARIRRQQRESYRLLALWDGDRAVACAGYRVTENLVRGPFLYVDDLVTASDARSHGLGARMLAAIAAEARARGLRTVVLDSNLQNGRAHRFYFRQGFAIRSFRFALSLDG